MKHARWWPAALGLMVLLSACSKPQPAPEPTRSVKLVLAAPVTGVAARTYAGEVKARTESRLGFRVAGKLLQRLVEPGQTVKSGQLLAVLDASDYQLGVEAAQAQVVAALTQKDQADADLRRFESLLAQGFISAAEVERRQATAKAAKATWDQARAQAAVQRNQAAYTRLVADTDGVVVGVDAEPGQLVALGASVVRIARNGPRDVVFNLPEDQLTQVRVGLAATTTLWAGATGAPLAGVVREIAAAADPLTRTYAVKVGLSAPVSPPLGATATVALAPGPSVVAAQAAAVKVPTGALWKQGSNSAVWVFDASSGQVQARTVQVAGLDGNMAVVLQGLRAGEEVVAAGVHVLTEGQKVVRFDTAGSR
ncbi:MAG: hypothetical protein RJA09_1288 [Pseudomonadota bacterium]|jgi:RND family efflux transporter MFP subunit